MDFLDVALEKGINTDCIHRDCSSIRGFRFKDCYSYGSKDSSSADFQLEIDSRVAVLWYHWRGVSQTRMAAKAEIKEKGVIFEILILKIIYSSSEYLN